MAFILSNCYNICKYKGVITIRFEKIKEPQKDSKIHKLIDEFIKTNYDRVEVINENDYDDNKKMTAAMRWVIKHDYSDKVKVANLKERVYLSKLNYEIKKHS